MARRAVGTLLALFALLIPGASEASVTPEGITIHQPGYSVAFVVSLPSAPTDIEIDAGGNLVVPMADGIRKITSGGAISLWSNSIVGDLTLTPGGAGYGAGPGTTGITSLDSGGTGTNLHQDTSNWGNVALSADGTLYAAIAFEPGHGFFQIDRGTGQPTSLIQGGPGVGGDGYYGPMSQGPDGRLYMLSRDAAASVNGGALFRLDGAQFTRVATLPETFFQSGMTSLTQGPPRCLFGALYVPLTNGSFLGQVYIIDPVTGDCTLLASAYNPLSIGYDPVTTNLYVAEQMRLMKLWVITGVPATPVRTESWGAIKALYRGERTAAPVPGGSH